MRFRDYRKKAPSSARASSGIASPLRTPLPPPPRTAAPWRSLWSRLHGRWAAAPATAPAFIHRDSCEIVDIVEPVSSAPSIDRASHLGIRAYLHRKRGELWFLTKRRLDGGPHSISDAEEVEVSPPPLRVHEERAEPSPKPDARRRPLGSLRSKEGSSRSWVDSEIEIEMSSFSQSDSDDEDESDAVSDDDEQAAARDSYESHVARDTSDLFLQRISSFCSIDGDDEDGDGREDESTSHEPTLEQLYEVRYVAIGGTPTPIVGIWV